MRGHLYCVKKSVEPVLLFKREEAREIYPKKQLKIIGD
jgi:hypothetical protein